MSNPAESIRISAIATFEPRTRALTPSEVRVLTRVLNGMLSPVEFERQQEM